MRKLKLLTPSAEIAEAVPYGSYPKFQLQTRYGLWNPPSVMEPSFSYGLLKGRGPRGVGNLRLPVLPSLP